MGPLTANPLLARLLIMVRDKYTVLTVHGKLLHLPATDGARVVALSQMDVLQMDVEPLLARVRLVATRHLASVTKNTYVSARVNLITLNSRVFWEEENAPS